MAVSSEENWYDTARGHMLQIGTSPENWTNRAVVAAALRRGVQVTKRDRTERLILTHGGRNHWWRDGLSSLNTRLARRVTRQKDVLSALLRSQDVPLLTNQVFTEGEEDRAWQWGRWCGPLVVKPADATGGVQVYTKLTSKSNFLDAFNSVASTHGRVLVEEFRQGIEYRFTTVKGRVIAVARRDPAHVVGNGKKTITKLVDSKNDERWRAPSHKQLKLTPHEVTTLEQQGFIPSTVLADGHIAYLRATSNLHTGGDAVDVTNDILRSHLRSVERAARGLPGARLLGLDVIISNEGEEGDLGIIEINTGPMISMHHLPWQGQPRDVAGAIVEAMFPDLRQRRSLHDWVEKEEESAQASSDVRPSSGQTRKKLRRKVGRMLRRYPDGLSRS